MMNSLIGGSSTFPSSHCRFFSHDVDKMQSLYFTNHLFCLLIESNRLKCSFYSNSHQINSDLQELCRDSQE